jgi:hypothetical protein
MRLIEALIASQALPALRTLRLKNFPLGDEPVARLVGHPWCTRLEVLDLSQNYCITQADALVASQHLDGLKQLDLRRTHLIEDRLAVEALRRRFGERVRL